MPSALGSMGHTILWRGHERHMSLQRGSSIFFFYNHVLIAMGSPWAEALHG